MSQVSQLSRSRRPKWHYLAVGVGLIVVAISLTVAWGILAAPEVAGPRAVTPARVVAYFFGSVMFLLLIAGLVLIVLLLLREVRLNERQSNFVSAVTHELKTPVASLKLYLETLEYRDVAPERRSEFYRTMRQDIERLNTTINNVLNAAMYTDRPVAEPRPLDLARVARRAAELTLTRHQLAKDAIRYGGPREPARGRATRKRSRPRSLNLLDNAVKYSTEKVEVELDVWGDADGQAHVRVSDHGIGMSRTHLPFIFTRFYRIGAEVRRSRTGTGSGAVHRPRRSSRATRARSRSTAPGPTAARASRSRCRACSSRSPSRTASRRRLVPRILLVEDEEHLASGIRFNLELDGYEVETIADGLRALERLVPPADGGPERATDRPRACST